MDQVSSQNVETLLIDLDDTLYTETGVASEMRTRITGEEGGWGGVGWKIGKWMWELRVVLHVCNRLCDQRLRDVC